MGHQALFLFAALLMLLSLNACASNTTASPVVEPATVAQGRVLYEEHCAACHGIQGEGEPNWERPDARGLFPAPPHDETGHTWHHPDQLLLQIIAEGGQMPGSRMPAFESTLTDEEMESVLSYIKTFWTNEQRAIQADITQRQP